MAKCAKPWDHYDLAGLGTGNAVTQEAKSIDQEQKSINRLVAFFIRLVGGSIRGPSTAVRGSVIGRDEAPNASIEFLAVPA